MKLPARLIIYATSIGILLFANNALAQAASPDALDAIPDLFKAKFEGMEAALTNDAKKLFGLLAIIEFSYAAFQLAFKQADIGQWAGVIVNQLLFLGIGFYIVSNGANIGGAFVDSFRQSASGASVAVGGVGTLSPSDVFNSGVTIAQNGLDNMSLSDIPESIAYAISSLIIVVVFALIVAMMILSLVSAWGIVTMSILFLGFGGSRWTKDIAMKAMTGILGVGAKLFVMQIIVGVGGSIFTDFATKPVTTAADLIIMVGFSVVMLALVKVIPDTVQALISGAAFTGGGAMIAAAGAVAGAASNVAAQMLGAGAAATGAGKLASQQLATQDALGTAPQSSAARLMNLASNTMQNLGKAAMDDIGAKLGGRAHHGTFGGRMGDRMSSQADELKAARETPMFMQSQNEQSKKNDDERANIVDDDKDDGDFIGTE